MPDDPVHHHDLAGHLLIRLADALPADLALVADAVLRERVGSDLAQVWLVDYDGVWMRRWPGPGGGPDELPLYESHPGAAFRTGRTQVEADGDGWWVHLSMVVQGQPLAVLSVRLAEQPSAGLIATLGHAAVAAGHCLVAGANLSDTYERTRRRRPLTLAAEIQWSQLPTTCYGNDRVTVAGQLLPAYDVGGDLFDCVASDDLLCVTALDAMGHGVQAARLSVLAVSAMRNARRSGLSLVEQVEAADEALLRQHGGDLFVTALALALDLHTGRLEVVNAGHPGLLLVRGGEVIELSLEPHLPVGMFENTHYPAQHLQLQPGDRLVVVSDGVLDAGPVSGGGDVHRQAFGDSTLGFAVLSAQGLGSQEAVRHVLGELARFQPDQRDDATVIILDWAGPVAVAAPRAS